MLFFFFLTAQAAELSAFTTAGKGWRYEPTELCLDRPKPILARAKGVTVVIEENSWVSQKIVASALAILASELLGYTVVFNPVPSSAGIYRRAAWQPSPGDGGEYIEDRMKTLAGNAELLAGSHVYVQPEVWRNSKLDEITEVVGVKGRATELGGIGYEGQSGVYVSSKFADHPYFMRFYNAFNSSSKRNEKIYADADPALREKCMAIRASSTSGTCFGRQNLA